MKLFKRFKKWQEKVDKQEELEEIAKVEAIKKQLEQAGKLKLELRLFDIQCIKVIDGVNYDDSPWAEGVSYLVSYSGMPSEDKFVLSRILPGRRVTVFEPKEAGKGIPYYLPKNVGKFKIWEHEFQVLDVNKDRLLIEYIGQGYAQLDE